MTPAAFAGWSYGCVLLLAYTALNETNNLQIFNISSSGVPGIYYLVILGIIVIIYLLLLAMSAELLGNIPVAAAAGWTSASLALLTDACAGFTYPQFNEIPFTSYSGWHYGCVSNLNTIIFANITSDQLAYLLLLTIN